MSATKRVLTESANAYSQAQRALPPDGLTPTQVSPDLYDEISNAARRVRYSVGQGYLTDRFTPLSNTPTITQDDTNHAYGFRSEVDTLRTVFATTQREVPRFCDAGDPPIFGKRGLNDDGGGKKRGVHELDDVQEAEKSDDGEGDDDATMTSSSTAGPVTGRLIREPPVRSGKRTFGRATRSLPASSFAFAGSVPKPALPSTALAPNLVTPATTAITNGKEVDFSEFFEVDEF